MYKFDDEVIKDSLMIIRDHCLDNNYKIAAAESVTSGMIQLMLSCCENAGLFFSGGITAYSCKQKQKQLGISEAVCSASNGVSSQIAESMARQICRKYSCELGLGITGFATPIPEKGITELFAYGSFCYNEQIIFTTKLTTNKATQLEVQRDFAFSLLQHCADCLETGYKLKGVSS